MTRIVTAGASPSIQKTIFFRLLELGGVNRSGAFRLDASGKAVNAARVLHQLAPGSCVNVSPLGEENSALFLSLADNDALPVVSVSIPGRTRFVTRCWSLLRGEPPNLWWMKSQLPGIISHTRIVLSRKYLTASRAHKRC